MKRTDKSTVRETHRFILIRTTAQQPVRPDPPVSPEPQPEPEPEYELGARLNLATVIVPTIFLAGAVGSVVYVKKKTSRK